jgi:hypothetical protein
MSYAKIKITVGSVNPLTHTGVTITLNLPDATIVLTGYPSFDAVALSQPNTFPLHSSSTITSQGLIEPLRWALRNAGYGYDKVSMTYDTSSDVVVLFNVYLRASISGSTSTPFSLQLTQEVIENFTVTDIQVSEADSDKCQMAKFTLSVAQGTPPYTIRRSGVEVANGLAFDFSRSDMARSFTITDSADLSATFTLPFVREYSFGQISQVPKPAGTDITINTTNSGLGSPLTLEYSIDGINWQNSNFFPLVELGPRTIYLRDALGCEKQLDIIVGAIQFIDVRAVHNPVNFEIVKPSAGAPAWLDIAIEIDGQLAGAYKAYPWRVDGSNTIYLFSADEPIRQYMPAIDDYASQINSAAPVQNMQARAEIKERTPGTAVYNEVATFIAVNAARQIGLAGESLLDLLQNNEPPFIFVQGQPGYLYWYDNVFYREKMLLTQNTTITRGGKSKTVEVLPYCDGDVILKYLDRNGMYRLYKFSRFYRREIEPELIGSIENVFGSLSTAQGYKKNIGYKSQEELTVKAVAVPARHMESLKDIYTSPRVYMHIGALGDDNASDWVLVDVKGDGMIKHNRRQFNDIELTILPPANNEITML